MAKLNLTEEEKSKIIEVLNENTEPSPELMEKLFPSVAERFDVAKLDRAKIATLEYAGKRSEAAILNQASPTDAGSPLQVERCFRGGSLTNETQLDLFEKARNEPDDRWQNLIVQGDNLQFLKTCYQNVDALIKDRVKGNIRLIYVDPPFATRSDFRGPENEKSYSDKVDSTEFIEGLRERLIYMREILADDGSIYVHSDWRMNNYLRLVMEEVFGKERFRNEIIWCYTGASQTKTRFIQKHENIIAFSKGKSPVFNWQDVAIPYSEETIARTGRGAGFSGLYGESDPEEKHKARLKFHGKIPEDWWTDIYRIQGNAV